MGNPRRYTWVRRAVLGASVAVFLGVPAWHLSMFAGSGALTGNILSDLAARGGLEPAIVGAPWSVSILGLEFMDPLAAIGVAVAGGWSLPLLLAVLPSLLLLGVVGRFFCGWLCPTGPCLRRAMRPAVCSRSLASHHETSRSRGRRRSSSWASCSPLPRSPAANSPHCYTRPLSSAARRSRPFSSVPTARGSSSSWLRSCSTRSCRAPVSVVRSAREAHSSAC